MNNLTIQQRAELYNTEWAHLGPPNVPFTCVSKNGRTFAFSFWFCGGPNISSFYGSFQVEYWKRINSMFPDCRGKKQCVQLFSGSLPPSEEYTRVGKDFTGGYKADLEIDAHALSSHLPFRPKMIHADPPYSVEDSEHYKCSMVDRPRIVSECGRILEPGGWLVWLDQNFPIFSNDTFRFCGAIGYIRSTGNRFRMVSIFQKLANAK